MELVVRQLVLLKIIKQLYGEILNKKNSHTIVIYLYLSFDIYNIDNLLRINGIYNEA